MLLISDFKRKLMDFSCLKLFVYIAAFEAVVVSSERFHSLVQNPGKGVNFYGKIGGNPEKDGLSSENIYGGSAEKNCTYCGKTPTYQDPGIICEIQNPIQCDYSYPYRTYDGSCNNLYISKLGIVNQCYLRFLPPYYEGDGGFRQSVKGGPLPQPRDISLKIFKDRHRPNVKISFQFVSFGQFMAFDLVHSDHPSLDCCSEENVNKPECKPILLKPDDPFYSQFGKTCLDFKRTIPCSCDTKYRSQKNGVTSAIDLSHLYSISKDRSKTIRALDGTGKLKTNDTSVGYLLPTGKDPKDPFCPKLQEAECFYGGDTRVNQHASFTSLVTVYTREHNRIASRLKQINPQWEEEKLFQETRKILIAEHQNIIFKDYLPIVVSPRIVEEFGMTVKNGTNGIPYDPSVILGIWNEFAIASYRLHTILPSNIGALNLRFKDTFSNPDLLHQGHLSTLIKGSQKVPSETFNRYMVKDLSDYLLQMPGQAYGQDLAAINVQRGRDHGLAPYVDAVKFCSDGTILISSFDDLYQLGLMPKKNVNLLKRIYAAVEDVDMWVGMQLENLMPGAITGPSAACINIKQFYFNQKGDRFYYDLVGPQAQFTAAQRNTLKQSSLPRILCDNTDINQITKNPLLIPDNGNTEVSCNEFPEIDLMQWKDNGDATSTS